MIIYQINKLYYISIIALLAIFYLLWQTTVVEHVIPQQTIQVQTWGSDSAAWTSWIAIPNSIKQ